jgi:hypothetical protein
MNYEPSESRGCSPPSIQVCRQQNQAEGVAANLAIARPGCNRTPLRARSLSLIVSLTPHVNDASKLPRRLRKTR